MEIKKPTTYEEQITLLENKNIVINNKDASIRFLNRVGYYRLSGYYLPYINRETDKCFSQTDFVRIENIYYFDSQLRSLVAQIIEEIEIYLKSQFSYYHAHKYGPEGYRKSDIYNSHHRHEAFLDRLDQCIDDHANTPVVTHHKNKYDGHFPIWVIIDFFSIGMLSYFYGDWCNSDKAKVAKDLYGTNYQTLDSWLRCFTDLRNKCAHASRLYYWKFSATPKMPEKSYNPTKRLFAQLYMLKYMYPDKENWNTSFVQPLGNLIGKYKPYISLKHLDFPDNWESMLTNVTS